MSEEEEEEYRSLQSQGLNFNLFKSGQHREKGAVETWKWETIQHVAYGVSAKVLFERSDSWVVGLRGVVLDLVWLTLDITLVSMCTTYWKEQPLNHVR